MAGVITTASHPKALWPGIKAWWGQTYAEHAVEYDKLFDKDTSNQNYEEDVQLSGFGLVPIKTEGQGVNYDSEIQGFVTRYTHIAYAMGYIVTKEELDDNLYESISKRRAAALAMSFRQTKENVAANIYNRAFNSTYKGGDGVELCSTAHPNTTGGTFSNKLSVDADLSEASLEDALKIAKGIGYPVIIKATAGGGGKGMRRVNHSSELLSAAESASAEASSAFGDGTVNDGEREYGLLPNGVQPDKGELI